MTVYVVCLLFGVARVAYFIAVFGVWCSYLLLITLLFDVWFSLVLNVYSYVWTFGFPDCVWVAYFGLVCLVYCSVTNCCVVWILIVLD